MSNINDLFGSDSEPEAEDESSTVPQQKQFDEHELFGSDSDDEPEEPVKASRLKKAKKTGEKGTKKTKEKKPKESRVKKRPRSADDSDNESKKANKNANIDEGNAYDSGDEVVATKADDGFIDSDDDLKDIAKEYDEERQDFNDEHDDEFEKRDVKVEDKSLRDEMKQGKKKSKDMEGIAKAQIVSSLLGHMEDAWTKDMKALIDEPPRPALNKLAMLDKVSKILAQRNLHDTLLDLGILEQVRNWLFPWPNEDVNGKDLPLSKRILPNLTLRSTIYQLLLTMPITPEHLKSSERGGVGRSDWPGLGKVILLLMKHPQETMDCKRLLKKLLEEWSRQLFKKPKDFKHMASSIRESDRVYKPQVGGSGLNRANSQVVDDMDNQGADGDASLESARAQRPFRVGFDFKIKPKNVEIKPAKIGKNQAKKNSLSLKLKDLKKKAKMGSQRGVIPSNKVYD